MFAILPAGTEKSRGWERIEGRFYEKKVDTLQRRREEPGREEPGREEPGREEPGREEPGNKLPGYTERSPFGTKRGQLSSAPKGLLSV